MRPHSKVCSLSLPQGLGWMQSWTSERGRNKKKYELLLSSGKRRVSYIYRSADLKSTLGPREVDNCVRTGEDLACLDRALSRSLSEEREE